jgi:hypothetical protein
MSHHGELFGERSLEPRIHWASRARLEIAEFRSRRVKDVKLLQNLASAVHSAVLYSVRMRSIYGHMSLACLFRKLLDGNLSDLDLELWAFWLPTPHSHYTL